MKIVHQKTRICLSFLYYRRFSTLSTASSTTDTQMLKCVLDDCKTPLDLKTVLKTHVKIVKFGFGTDFSLVSRLSLTYIYCGNLDHARRLLDETLCWNVDLITGNVMITSFMKSGDVDAAKRVFLNMPSRDVVSWNSLIGGFVKNSRLEEALGWFKDMCSRDVEPDEFTFTSVVSACAQLGVLDHALWINNLLIEKEIAINDILLSALIDMYAKCGKIEIARKVFNPQSSSVSVWNSMITGLAIHGLANDAISVFSLIEENKVFPDSITFLGILTACSHCGLVEMGKRYFDIMRKQYFIEPKLEHYGAMVDLLARAGQLDEAYAIIRAMPMQPDVVIWKTILSACRTYKNASLGEIAVTKVSSLDGGDYVLLSNTYCYLNQWSNSESVRDIMNKRRVRKDHGKSWIELAGIIHHFKAGGAHPEKGAIDKILNQLNKRAKIEGFVPATESVLMDVSEEEREENLNSHSEKIALAFGILKTCPRTEIRISKNLRTCSDCHSWFKIVSRMLTRVIIVRDRVRFHKFDGGACSCGDYW